MMAFLLPLISASLYLTSTAHDLDCLRPGATTRHDTDCSSYYKCGENLEHFLFKCPEGESFDAENEKCDASENVKCSGLDEKLTDAAALNIKELLDKMPRILYGIGSEHHYPPDMFDSRPDDERNGEQLPAQEVVNYEDNSKQIEKRNTDEEVNNEEPSLEIKTIKGGTNESPEAETKDIEKKHEGEKSTKEESETHDANEEEHEKKEIEETQETEMAENPHSYEEKTGETINHSVKEKGPIHTYDNANPGVHNGEEIIMSPIGSIRLIKYHGYTDPSTDESRESSENEEEQKKVEGGDGLESNESEDGEHDQIEGLKEEIAETQASDKKNNEDTTEDEHNNEKENDEETVGHVEVEVKDDGMKYDETKDDEIKDKEKIEDVEAKINVDGIKDSEYGVKKGNEDKLEDEEVKVNNDENLNQDGVTTTESWKTTHEETSTVEGNRKGSSDDTHLE